MSKNNTDSIKIVSIPYNHDMEKISETTSKIDGRTLSSSVAVGLGSLCNLLEPFISYREVLMRNRISKARSLALKVDATDGVSEKEKEKAMSDINSIISGAEKTLVALRHLEPIREAIIKYTRDLPGSGVYDLKQKVTIWIDIDE